MNLWDKYQVVNEEDSHKKNKEEKQYNKFITRIPDRRKMKMLSRTRVSKKY